MLKWIVYLLGLLNLAVVLFVFRLPEVESPEAPPAPNLPRVETLRMIQEYVPEPERHAAEPITDECWALKGFETPRAARDWAQLRRYPVSTGDVARVRDPAVTKLRLLLSNGDGAAARKRAGALAARGVGARIIDDGEAARVLLKSTFSYRELLDWYRRVLPAVSGQSRLEYTAHPEYSYALVGGDSLRDHARRRPESGKGAYLRLVPCESVANAGENP